jgi:hypothetical protein
MVQAIPHTGSLRRLMQRAMQLRHACHGALVLTLLAGPVTAQSAQEATVERWWTPELLLRYRAIMAVAVSPTGDRVA